MPICYHEIIGEKNEIFIWKITETESELLIGLSLSSEALERFSRRKSSVHRKGYLAIRQLLKSLKIPPETHKYDNEGAPYLTDGRFLSISHTGDVAAVVISSASVGIDLEHYKDKIRHVATRFLHISELRNLRDFDEIICLTQLWTAKEALFKLYKKPRLIFSEQICIHQIKKEDTKGTGSVIENSKATHFPLEFRRFKNYCLTLATIY